MLLCKVLTSEAEAETIAPAWRELHQRLGLAPFTDYDWFRAWWDTVGNPAGASPLIVACFDGARLVGVLPFSIRAKAGVKVLRLAGHEPYYYRNLLAETPEACVALWNEALAYPGYDFANIKNMHLGTPEDDLLSRRAFRIHESGVHYIEHSGLSPEAFLAARSGAYRRKLKRMRAAVTEKGAVFHTYAGGAYPREAIDFLVARKKAWCEEKDKRGFFGEAGVGDFYHAITRLAQESGTLFLHWITQGEEVVAAAVGYGARGTMYGHTLAYELGMTKASPGILTNIEMTLDAIARGYRETNLMEGEESYKKRLAQTHRIIREYAYARTLKGWVYLLLYRVVQSVRMRRLYRGAAVAEN